MTQRNLLKISLFRESFPDRKTPAVKILEVGVQLSCWVMFAFLKILRRRHALYCLAGSSQTGDSRIWLVGKCLCVAEQRLSVIVGKLRFVSLNHQNRSPFFDSQIRGRGQVFNNFDQLLWGCLTALVKCNCDRFRV